MNKLKTIIITTSSAAILTLGLVLGLTLPKSSEPADVIFYNVSFNSNGGSEVPGIKVAAGKRVTKPSDPSKTGYYLNNWEFDNKEWNFEVDTVSQDMTLSAVWGLTIYNISYNFTGGSTSETYETTYTIESDFDLVRPNKDGFVFVGWFDDAGNRYDSITPGKIGNIELTAKWTGNFHAISEDESRGLINVYASETNPNEYTVANSPINNKHHLFKGWYDKDGNLLSTNVEYTIIVSPNESFYIYSRYMNDQEENNWNKSHGVSPTIQLNKVMYGMYPQSNVNEPAIINKLEESKQTRFNGYYYFNHEYYVKKTAKLARDLITGELLSVREFDNGDEFTENETYWFKVDPLSWNVINQSNNEYYLASEKLLEVKKYHGSSSTREIDDETIYCNNYKYSNIREWLNNDFVNTTFAFDKLNLSIMEVDNSSETTATPDSGLECENTFDYVTLLSYKEQEQKTLVERQIKTTDYVRVCGANYSVDGNNLFSGYYWTRSPIKTENDEYGTLVSRCNMNGSLNEDYVGWGGSCVQPSIKINNTLNL